MNLRKARYTGKSRFRLGQVLLVILLFQIAFLSGCGARPKSEGSDKTLDLPISQPTTTPVGSPTTFISPPLTPTTAAVFSSPLATPLPKIVLPGRFTFHSNVGGGYQIYTMEGNGQNMQQLTSKGSRNIEPVWSPDGELIAFASDRDNVAGLDIYVMNADGSDQRSLTSHAGYALSPSWSPDGKRLVFHTNWEVRFQLYTIELEDGETQKLFDIPANAYMPDWSPDGSRIAFVGDQDGGNDDIYVVELDSGEITRITDNLERDSRPRWSPDGARLAYQRYKGDDIDIIVQDLETSEVLTVLDDKSRDTMPAWADGGKSLVVSSSVSESSWALHTFDFEGNRYLLLAQEGDLRYPQWTQ